MIYARCDRRTRVHNASGAMIAARNYLLFTAVASPRSSLHLVRQCFLCWDRSKTDQRRPTSHWWKNCAPRVYESWVTEAQKPTQQMLQYQRLRSP